MLWEGSSPTLPTCCTYDVAIVKSSDWLRSEWSFWSTYHASMSALNNGIELRTCPVMSYIQQERRSTQHNSTIGEKTNKLNRKRGVVIVCKSIVSKNKNIVSKSKKSDWGSSLCRNAFDNLDTLPCAGSSRHGLNKSLVLLFVLQLVGA
jgi:hypothetical protein